MTTQPTDRLFLCPKALVQIRKSFCREQAQKKHLYCQKCTFNPLTHDRDGNPLTKAVDEPRPQAPAVSLQVNAGANPPTIPASAPLKLAGVFMQRES